MGDDLPLSAISSDRLDSWKEIAVYLRRHVRTVQRWAKDEHLPIHRHPHKKAGSVYAYKAELDDWWQSAQSTLLESAAPAGPVEEEEFESRSEEHSPRSMRVGFVAAGVVAATILGLTAGSLLSGPTRPLVSSIMPITSDLFWKNSMASDGLRAFYTRTISGRTHLVSAATGVGGGFPTEIAVTMARPHVLAVSNSGTQMLLLDSESGAPGPVMVRSFTDRSLHKLSGVTASCAAWSPQDEWIAFCNGRSVFRVLDGGKPEKLATLDGVPRSIVWSPDGDTLRVLITTPPPPAASRRAEESVWLREINAASGRVSSIELPESVRSDCAGSIAWVRDFFAFASQCLSSSNLWVSPQSRYPFFSKQNGWTQVGFGFGRIVQLARAREGNELLVLEEQSGPLQLIRYDPKSRAWAAVALGLNPVELDESRDGNWVAYVEYPQRTLWRSRPDGSERKQLTVPPLRVQLPHWSPDGKTIAFTGIMPGAPWQIFLVGADGDGLRKAAGKGSDQGCPTWSPDGNELVFGDIEIDRPDSHFIRRADLRTGKVTNVPGSAGLRTARWSPDGRFIAAIRYPAQELVLFDVSAMKWSTVAAGVAGDTLNWSADSLSVFFAFPFDPHPGIYRYDLKSSSVEPALLYGPFRKLPSVMGDTSGFSVSRDGSIVLNASEQSSRIYSMRLSEN